MPPDLLGYCHNRSSLCPWAWYDPVTLSGNCIANRLPGALIAIRLLLGFFEAGFYPTAVFYLSTFYTRFDLGVRIGLFYGQYAVAGAFSGAIGAK